MRVHVRPDAETEDASPPIAALFDSGDDLVLVGRADSGAAIGEEDDDEGTRVEGRGSRVEGRMEGEGLFESIVNGGAADGLEIFDKILRLRAALLARFDQLVEQRLDFGREPNDLKPVAVIEVLDAKLQRLLGLLQLVARHRAGGIEDERHILGDHLLLCYVHAG